MSQENLPPDWELIELRRDRLADWLWNTHVRFFEKNGVDKTFLRSLLSDALPPLVEMVDAASGYGKPDWHVVHDTHPHHDDAEFMANERHRNEGLLKSRDKNSLIESGMEIVKLNPEHAGKTDLAKEIISQLFTDYESLGKAVTFWNFVRSRDEYYTGKDTNNVVGDTGHEYNGIQPDENGEIPYDESRINQATKGDHHQQGSPEYAVYIRGKKYMVSMATSALMFHNHAPQLLQLLFPNESSAPREGEEAFCKIGPKFRKMIYYAISQQWMSLMSIEDNRPPELYEEFRTTGILGLSREFFQWLESLRVLWTETKPSEGVHFYENTLKPDYAALAKEDIAFEQMSETMYHVLKEVYAEASRKVDLFLEKEIRSQEFSQDGSKIRKPKKELLRTITDWFGFTLPTRSSVAQSQSRQSIQDSDISDALVEKFCDGIRHYSIALDYRKAIQVLDRKTAARREEVEHTRISPMVFLSEEHQKKIAEAALVVSLAEQKNQMPSEEWEGHVRSMGATPEKLMGWYRMLKDLPEETLDSLYIAWDDYVYPSKKIIRARFRDRYGADIRPGIDKPAFLIFRTARGLSGINVLSQDAHALRLPTAWGGRSHKEIAQIMKGLAVQDGIEGQKLEDLAQCFQKGFFHKEGFVGTFTSLRALLFCVRHVIEANDRFEINRKGTAQRVSWAGIEEIKDIAINIIRDTSWNQKEWETVVPQKIKWLEQHHNTPEFKKWLKNEYIAECERRNVDPGKTLANRQLPSTKKRDDFIESLPEEIVAKIKGKRIAVLPIAEPYFSSIYMEEKKEEYREITPYWTSRLKNLQEGDVLEFRNGYKPLSPTMWVVYQGRREVEIDGKLHYALQLGEILGGTNLKPETLNPPPSQLALFPNRNGGNGKSGKKSKELDI